MKKALITGINGQDGSFLAELLLDKNYEVHGLVRRASTFNTERIDHIDNDKLVIHHGDVTDPCNIYSLLQQNDFDEIYHLAGAAHVAESFTTPLYTANVNALGTLALLDAIKNINPKIKMYTAVTSELYGGLPETAPQDESTPFYVKSPYGASKLYAYWITKNYRESYNLLVSNGILFNHESERRLPTYVTRKITYGISRILKGEQDVIKLGNLMAKRDWGYSKDYCEAMWMILQHTEPLDLVIATGETHTVKEFIEEAFKYISIDIQWRGFGVDEEGYDPITGKVWIKVDPKYFRPSEVEHLEGNASLAKRLLGWQPKTTFSELVRIMMKHDLELAGIKL